MIHKLRQDEYEKVRSLFRPLTYHLTINSIIKGLTPAQILVDNPNIPKSAFTWFRSKAWLAGDTDNDSFNNDLRKKLNATYFKELRDHGGGFRLHCSPSWEPKIDDVFGSMPKMKGHRLYYNLDASTMTWELSVPDGFKLIPVDEDLLSKTHLGNLDHVVEEMQSERLTVESFLDKSFGYCVVHDDDIVGWCMSEYNSDGRCELGIATVKSYRREGLATLMGTAVIRHALTQGIREIGWHCWADNRSSVATAKRLGFTKQKEYCVYWITI